MDNQEYSAGLTKLRAVRDELKSLERKLRELQGQVDKPRERRAEMIRQLGGYEKATSDRLATSAGLAVIDIVALVPSPAPQGAPEGPVQPPATGNRHR
ncbi:hypothetical protein [Streptomyces sp. NPDC097981]|uniref:hypothetical protein n=1 Tax=Streptomyces sp. NPDC097981 TaxID=3155428 RepID=UPI00332EF922